MPVATQANETKVWVADAVNTRNSMTSVACRNSAPERAECAPGQQIGWWTIGVGRRGPRTMVRR